MHALCTIGVHELPLGNKGLFQLLVQQIEVSEYKYIFVLKNHMNIEIYATVTCHFLTN